MILELIVYVKNVIAFITEVVVTVVVTTPSSVIGVTEKG